MNCNCKWTNAVLSLIIIIFAVWTPVTWAKWIVVIAAVLLFLYSLRCFGSCETAEKPKSKKK